MSRDAVIVICSRPESSRLPRKVFRRIAGVPAIEHILKRLNGCGLKVVLAVPSGCYSYDHYVANAMQENVDLTIYRGNPLSPLHRTADAIHDLKLEHKWIVRITHDDILIDQQTMLELIDECNRKRDCGYGVSPKIVDGAGVEVIHRDNLIEAAKNRIEPTEYISYFVKSKPHSVAVKYTPRETIRRNYRLTMDYPEDVVVLETIMREVGVNASLDVICAYLDRNTYILRANAQPKVSVYTCAYNASDYIYRTMESVLSQPGFTDYEYIVVDDGSSDDTLVKAMKFNHDKRVRYHVNESNMGLATSSNIAIGMARGEYLMRVDADDLILPRAMGSLVDCMDTGHYSVVYPSYKEINEREDFISDAQNPATHHHAGCAMMDKRMINEIRFTNGLKHWDSKDLYLRIKEKFKIGYLQDPMWLYRRHTKSMSLNNIDERKEVLKEVVSRAERSE